MSWNASLSKMGTPNPECGAAALDLQGHLVQRPGPGVLPPVGKVDRQVVVAESGVKMVVGGRSWSN